MFNKPFGVVSQFSGGQPNLSDYIKQGGFYPAGRLDKDSEGLLLLTNDGRLQARIADPKFKMRKTYLVQVEGLVSGDELAQPCPGVTLKDGLTLPATASIIAAPELPDRAPPIRFRAQRKTSWLELTIQEGRNRQVRRMTAAVGLPTLRLFRRNVGPWSLGDLAPGQYRLEQVNLPTR